jgi:hypothetical protein
MARGISRTGALVVCAALSHCSPQPAIRSATTPSVRTTEEKEAHLRGPLSTAECGPGYAACKHTSVAVSRLCYGQDPGPNAEWQRRACSCDECVDDSECGGGKRCFLATPTCGTPQRMCIEPCKHGACAANFVCGDGYCVPRRAGGPP